LYVPLSGKLGNAVGSASFYGKTDNDLLLVYTFFKINNTLIIYVLREKKYIKKFRLS